MGLEIIWKYDERRGLLSREGVEGLGRGGVMEGEEYMRVNEWKCKVLVLMGRSEGGVGKCC
jgi:hypothetical protein